MRPFRHIILSSTADKERDSSPAPIPANSFTSDSSNRRASLLTPQARRMSWQGRRARFSRGGRQRASCVGRAVTASALLCLPGSRRPIVDFLRFAARLSGKTQLTARLPRQRPLACHMRDHPTNQTRLYQHHLLGSHGNSKTSCLLTSTGIESSRCPWSCRK